MPKIFSVILLTIILTSISWSSEKRKPRWPLPKSTRELSTQNFVRITDYRNYLKSLSTSEIKEFTEDAKISLGSLGVNPERIIIKFKNAETEQAVYSLQRWS